MSAATTPRDERLAKRAGRLLLLLLLLGGAGAGLAFVASLSEPCGDGVCTGAEVVLCPADCALMAANAPGALSVPQGDLDGIAPEPPEPAPARPPAPSPPPAPAPQKAAAPDPPAAAPDPPAPVPDTRCQEPRFRAVATAVVKDCEHACKKDDSPLVKLGWDEFEALFGRPDDPGVATHFSLFGCNAYAPGRRSCRGFDSDVADPAECPPGNANCAAYAAPLKRELWDFLDAHAEAHTILLFGTASRTGNRGGRMSDDNADLAERRALAVQEVVNQWRRKHGKRDTRVFAVVMDNARTDYWQSPVFREVVKEQLAGVSRGVDRGFDAHAAHAINRSVMAVAISCEL